MEKNGDNLITHRTADDAMAMSIDHTNPGQRRDAKTRREVR
jgi:hypothetical protein